MSAIYYFDGAQAALQLVLPPAVKEQLLPEGHQGVERTIDGGVAASALLLAWHVHRCGTLVPCL